MECLKYKDIIVFLNCLIKLTKNDNIIWKSKLLVDKVKYCTSIPNSDINIILFNSSSVPDIFIETNIGVRKLRLIDSKFIYKTIQPAEEAAINLGIAVSDQVYRNEVQQIDKQINNYLKSF